MASSASSSIGFVGLGNMGLPMSINLAKKSSVVAFDMNEAALKIASDNGICPAGSLEEIGAAGCNVIFTMLPGCAAVDHVMPTLLESSQPGSSVIFVDCSTVSGRRSVLVDFINSTQEE